MQPPALMTFAPSLCVAEDGAGLASGLLAKLDRSAGTAPDLAFAFVRPPQGEDPSRLLADIRDAAGAAHFLACTAEGVIGGGHEIEGQSAASLVSGMLPGAEISGFSFGDAEWPDLLGQEAAFRAAVGVDAPPQVFLVLVDPFSTPVQELLAAFDAFYPGVPVLGGVASAGSKPGTNALAVNGLVRRDGAVGLALSGNIRVDIVVSQGCRPIGDLLTVTSGQRNMITGLDGRPPLEVLRRIYGALDPNIQALAQNGMLMGIASDSGSDDPGPGDFLIRNIAGADPSSGAIAVTDHVRQGQRVRFHVRDAQTATDDLELLLSPQAFDSPPAAGLLFSCNGRGRRLFDHPDGDISVVRRAVGDSCPIAGFFCAGELGPIGGRNHIHGQTASLVLFRPAR